MRLRNWIAVLVSVILLAAAGTIGILVNRSAVKAADTVHRADTRALAVNNGALIGQLQRLAVAELQEFLSEHALRLGRGSAADRRALLSLAAESDTFRYGALITDPTGAVLTSSRATGLPAATDAGWEPMRRLLATGGAGFSSVMTVDKARLQAIAVPIMVSGRPAGVLIGLNDIATTSLQKYVASVRDANTTSMVVDSTGRIGATDLPGTMGTKADPALVAALPRSQGFAFVEYTAGGTRMIAAAVGGLPGGWAYLRVQTKTSFDGAVHSRSQTLNVTLLGMLLIGVVAISALGYRTVLQRRRADERFQALFQHAPDLVSVLNPAGRIEYSSPSAATVLGYPSGAMVGKSVFDLVHPDDRQYMRDQFGVLLVGRDTVLRLQCRVRSASGEYRWFEFTASNQLQNPALAGVVINARDISENRAFQERLAHEAQHDALTGLPNRRRMQDALDASLRAEAVAVLFVDLDGFKPVNDAHGHEAGDELLRQVAERLGACVREKDVLARVGGDEFVVLMPGVQAEADAEAMGHRIRHAVGQPFRIDGHDVQIGASVGVHLAPSATDPDEALRAADHAMYSVKKSRDESVVQVGRHRADN
jgi:diguanylate cyclase (GGDEF)-like protein/PAS domain S-box-containing protein